MRAFDASDDQTRPTVYLQGDELAIGPAGTNPHGPWGIHVEPPVDGRAQELRERLETAALRCSKQPADARGGHRRFENRLTNVWSPGDERRARPDQAKPYYEPALVCDAGTPATVPVETTQRRATPKPRAPRKRGHNTVSEFGHNRPRPRRARHPSAAPTNPTKNLAITVGKTMPLGLSFTDLERLVLDELGRRTHLLAAEVAQLIGAADPLQWMGEFVSRLRSFGLDLVETREVGPGIAEYHLVR